MQFSKQFLKRVELQRPEIPNFKEYPFNLAAVRSFHKLDFNPKVTYFIGENGSGKSTLLEAIAIKWGFNPEGGTVNFNFATKDSHSSLHHYLKLIKGIGLAKDGFFLRAESFYNVASEVDKLDKESFRPLTQCYGGKSLHSQSHGESFLALMNYRFSGNGLYILDEPESALSPTSQMMLISKIHELISQNSQFIIATHSPIVLAYPNSTIYQVDESGVSKVKYEETDLFQNTKYFLNNYQRMLEQLLEE